MTLKEFLDRYGPTVAVLTLLGLLAVLLPGNSSGPTNTLSAGAGSGTVNAEGQATAGATDVIAPESVTGTADASGAAAGSGSAGVASKAASTGATGGAPTATPAGQKAVAAQSAPGGAKFGSGPDCRDDARQRAISYASPPCAEWQPGTPNGGATDKGVTGDKILVIRYRGQENAATSAALTGAGATDSREDTEKQYQTFVKYFNQHYQTYGREIVMKVFDATGASGNDEAARSDAIQIAEKLNAFAVLNASNVAAEELARKGVICVCTTTLSREFYGALPPYIFSSLPTSEGYGQMAAEYIGKRLAGRNANHAGDPTYKAAPRRFGYIWYEGEGGRADPLRKISHDNFVQELGKYNVSLSGDFGYIFDIAKAPDQAGAMVQKFKNDKVSTIILGVDPLYPIFFTQEATKQNYNPEWIVLGTALSDTTFFGRTYDKKQMQAMFGISPLFVSWADFFSSPGFRELKHADPSTPRDTNGRVAANVTRSGVATLFAGIHMAGPNLNQDTFAQGMFALPAIGGTPARPLIKFTRQDPTAIKDFREIFWDSTYSGRDEVNKDGVGAFLSVDGGKRYQLGQWPTTDPKVFTRDGAVFTSDDPPGGPQATNHEGDGHKHDPNQRCLSCT